MKFCPRCGQPSLAASPKFFSCGACGFTLFQNVAATVAAIIDCEGSILAAVRAEDPHAGKLDLPGGFVDPGETAEQALRRELAEELNLRNVTPVYFRTYPNIYPYKSVTYHTLDVFFTIKLLRMPKLTPADDVASIEWVKKEELDPQDFAFSSMRAALSEYTRSNRE